MKKVLSNNSILMKPIRSFLMSVICLPLCGSASAVVLVAAEGLPPGPERTGGSSMGVGGLVGVMGEWGSLGTYHRLVGQTFVPEYSGILATASFIIVNHLSGGVGDPLEFSLVRIMENGGFSDPLDTASVLSSSIPYNRDWNRPYQLDYSVTANFSGGIDLVAGEHYAIVIGSLADFGSHYRIWMPVESTLVDGVYLDDWYRNGSLFQNTLNGVVHHSYRDLHFRIEVIAIPETSSSLMILIAGAGGLLSHRRRWPLQGKQRMTSGIQPG